MGGGTADALADGEAPALGARAQALRLTSAIHTIPALTLIRLA
jgi:hypothetical protein